jgi:D-alanyl-lipoteichoic acid acyltransferase DltB (MBOAT superfamily)
MLFQSQVFILAFLPLTLAGYWMLRDDQRARENLLLVASLVFYGWWDARFVPLFLAHTLVAWGAAKLCERTGAKLWIDFGVALQLLSLATFKYADFIIGMVEQAAGVSLPRSGVVLPIGISFFTFQLISYMVDVRRGQSHAYPFREVLLYIAFFPQLVAGPIVRHQELLPQFALHPLRDGWEERFGKGLVLFILGFAKKVLLADNLAPLAEPAFAAGATPGFLDAWAGALAFSFQLFLDFSAYSEMAIGLGMMFGIVLPENFRAPYRAADIQDFWRRWHITLSSFFRDYVYKPLGGNRAGLGVGANLMITMGLCGLWHGAGFTYVVWGLYHGAGLVAHRLWRQAGMSLPFAAAWFVTMLFVVIGWVLFRAPDFATAGRVLGAMVGLNGAGAPQRALWLLPVAALVCVALPSTHQLADRWLTPHHALALASVALFVVCLLQVGAGQPVNFIYFQF